MPRDSVDAQINKGVFSPTGLASVIGGVSHVTIRQLCRTGRLPHRSVMDREIKINAPDALRVLLEAGIVSSGKVPWRLTKAAENYHLRLNPPPTPPQPIPAVAELSEHERGLIDWNDVSEDVAVPGIKAPSFTSEPFTSHPTPERKESPCQENPTPSSV